MKDSSDASPLPGVNVVLKGTSQGVATGPDGDFEMEVSSLSDTLMVSYVGYQTREVPLAGRSEVEVLLAPTSILSEELVVVGYGTVNEEELVSSVSSVNASDFAVGNVRDVGQLIQGKAPGLVVTNPSGDPTAGTQISLRGNTTLFGANSQPLVLINGVPGNLNTVAPENIESVDILKDGSAAAIYGTRGSNGVILITTKQASGEYATSATYQGYTTVQTIARQLSMLDAADYRAQIANGTREASDDFGGATDWMSQVGRTAVSQVHNLTYQGGNATTNYLGTLTYRGNEGIFLKSDNRTFQVQADINHHLFDDAVNLNLQLLSSDNAFTSTTDGGSFSGWTYRQALIRNPTEPVTDENGNWFERPGQFEYDNPVALLRESDGRVENKSTRVNGNITFDPIDELTLRAVLAYTSDEQSRGYAESKEHISNVRNGLNGYASNGTTTSQMGLAELTAEYDDTYFDDHDVTLLGGYSYQENTSRGYWMNNFDFPTDDFGYNNVGIGDALREGEASIGSSKWKTNLIGFFGRANYSFAGRYLLMGSLRYEAASELWGTVNPWGLFPAVSAGWRLTNEPFMRNQSVFDELKLRVGYGVTGSQPSATFLGVGKLGYQDYAYYGGRWIRTLTPTQNPNPNLRWEEKRELNFGADFSLLSDLLSGTLDYYVRRVDGLLYDYPVPSPPNIYSTTRANVGVMENRGLELGLNITPVRTDRFSWNSNVNFSTNSNVLKSISNDQYELANDFFTAGGTGVPIQTFTHLVEVGGDIGDFYGHKVIGVDEDGRWIYEDAEGNAVPYDDYDHTFANKQRLGNGIPNYFAAWNNNFRYRNFDLSITMRGAFDYQILNFQRMYYENTGRTQYNQLESAYEPVFGEAVLSTEMPVEFNSYYIENGDYWKIDNIVLGYTIPIDKVPYLTTARVYASTLNTLVLTGYRGIDPEVNQNGLSPGNDPRDKYPTTRQFTLGVNLGF